METRPDEVYQENCDWVQEPIIKNKADRIVQRIMRERTEEVDQAVIKSMNFPSLGKYWDVVYPRLEKQKYQYKMEQIRLSFTPSGKFINLHLCFIRSPPDILHFDISRKKALTLAKPLVSICMEMLFPDRQVDMQLKIVEPEIIETSDVFAPFTFELLSKDVRESKLVWSIHYIPTKPIETPSGLKFGFRELMIYLDSLSGEIVAWDWIG